MKLPELMSFAAEEYCASRCCAELPLSVICRGCPLYEFFEMLRKEVEE